MRIAVVVVRAGKLAADFRIGTRLGGLILLFLLRASGVSHFSIGFWLHSISRQGKMQYFNPSMIDPSWFHNMNQVQAP